MASDAQADLDPGSGPTPQTGTSLSQPLVNEAQRLLSRYQRTISDRAQNELPVSKIVGGQLPDKDYVILEELRREVLNVIIERLKTRNVLSNLVKARTFWWCLPKRLDQEPQFRLLLQDPYAIGTHMLKDMLVLEDSTPDSPNPPPNSVLFYIRTFTMQVNDLHNVLHAMLHDGFDMNERIYVWLERIEDMSDVSYVTLRYCGQSKNRPWDRHTSDIYSTSLRSFFNRFLKTSGMLCPSVLQNAKVQVVEHASMTSGAPVGAELLDATEQVLIALFGDSVLNTEAGGNSTVSLTKEDRDIFESLKTKTISALLSTQPCPVETQRALEKYAKDVRDYVSHHPTTTKGQNKQHKFSDITESMLVRQGMPTVLSEGSAPMVTLGSDLGDTHEEDEAPFFEASGRSADLVTTLYNNFGYWERGLMASFDEGLTKKLARQNKLPFVDLFPWFVKDKEDFKATSQFIRQYLTATKPYVLLAYGTLPTYAGMKNFKPFTRGAYETEYSNVTKANDREAYWLKEVMGIPQMASFDGDKGLTPGTEFILIPCLHPGRAGHAGILKTLITRLLTMVSGLCWAAMEHTITVDRNSPTLSRKEKCEQILGMLNVHLAPMHPFGRALKQLKSEYAIAQTADMQARHLRKATVAIGKPPRGILATKTQRKNARRDRVDRDAQIIEGVADGFELSIQEHPWNGVGDKDVRYSLTWVEEDGQMWTIGPIILPDNTLSIDQGDKRFLFFTPSGIDIRNGAGESKGDRKPLISGRGKVETLPIASLALTLCDQANAALFFSHWEDVTGLSINDVLGSRLANQDEGSFSFKTADQGFYPASFFEGYSKRGLPFTRAYQTAKTKQAYLDRIKAQIPVQPGDLIWLIDRFISEMLPDGGDIDLVPASIHANSIYSSIPLFCSRATYKHHPHLRTFLAFASMSEMGVDERLVPAIALTYIVEILFGKFDKKNKTVNVKLGNESRSMSRVVLTIKADRKAGVLHGVEDPELEQDIVIEDDVTDDEGQQEMSRGQKRQFDGDEDEGGESSKSGPKAIKGKDKGKVQAMEPGGMFGSV